MPGPNFREEASERRRLALSKWENEGGATVPDLHVPDLTNAELVQLRIRVIALENLLIAILAEGTDRQLQLAWEMADYISPRPDSVPHPLTIQAADHMTDLANRAIHFRTVEPGSGFS